MISKVFTWVGIIVFILFLLSLALPSTGGSGLKKRPIAQTASNYRQLFIITQSAYLDSQTLTGKGVFPGDLSNSFAAWSNSLVPSYCSNTNFLSMFKVNGKLDYTTVYAVKSSDPPNSVFLSTANLDASGFHDRPPYGLKRAAVVTLDGSVYILTIPNSAFTNLIWPKQTVKP